jgi:hypothetical protein
MPFAISIPQGMSKMRIVMALEILVVAPLVAGREDLVAVESGRVVPQALARTLHKLHSLPLGAIARIAAVDEHLHMKSAKEVRKWFLTP